LRERKEKQGMAKEGGYHKKKSKVEFTVKGDFFQEGHEFKFPANIVLQMFQKLSII